MKSSKSDFLIRLAKEEDVLSILNIRLSANENVLRNRQGLTLADLIDELKREKSAWVAQIGDEIVGFSWARKKQRTLWALFVLPQYQRQGIGKALMSVAVEWLWQQRTWWLGRINNIWLETKAGSPAEQFYQHLGWQRGELRPYGDVRYWLRRPQ